MSYLAYILKKISENPLRALRSAGKGVSEFRMDRRIGVSTGRRDFARHEGSEPDSKPCQPAPYSLLAQIEADILARGVPLRTFIDVGCGAGRALAYFSKLPFERMVGIEINPGVAELARRNMAAIRPDWIRAKRIDILASDIRDAEAELAGSVIYLANPFGDATMEAFVRMLQAQLQQAPRRETDIYYVLPLHPGPIETAFPGAERRVIQGIEPCLAFSLR